jgi:hypothetical protein
MSTDLTSLRKPVIRHKKLKCGYAVSHSGTWVRTASQTVALHWHIALIAAVTTKTAKRIGTSNYHWGRKSSNSWRQYFEHVGEATNTGKGTGSALGISATIMLTDRKTGTRKQYFDGWEGNVNTWVWTSRVELKRECGSVQKIVRNTLLQQI